MTTDRVSIALLAGHPTPAPEHRLSSPQEIASLPWRGNYFSDSELFAWCDAYIKDDAHTMNERAWALRMMTTYGMGDSSPVTEADVIQYCAEDQS